MPIRVDLTEDDNWLKVQHVKRVLGRELTDEEEREVLRVGTNAEFFQREKAGIEQKDRPAG